MATLTATANDALANIELYIQFDSFLVENQVTVVRIHPDATEHIVRGGYRFATFPVTLDYFLTDSEAPLDTAVTYRAFEDVVGLDPSSNVVTGGPVTITSGGYNWLKDPGRPWANVRVDLCGELGGPCADLADPVSLLRLGSKGRASDANLIPVLDRELPADIWARRKGIVSSITFLTRTLDAIDSVYDLFTAGGPLLLQIQPLFGWPDAYWQPGELTEVYTGSSDQRLPYRRWDVPLVQVDRPAPAAPAQGTACANWCLVEERYETSQDLANTGLTWLGVVDCTATPVPLPTDGYGFGPYGSGPYGDGG
jgi:hypothetical protein